MKLLRGSDNFIEVVDDDIALELRDANDLGNEARIEEERLPASDRVRSDNWVLVDNRLAAYSSTKVRLKLLPGSVLSEEQ